MPIDWQYLNFCAAAHMSSSTDKLIKALSVVFFNATPEQREVLVESWPNVFETYRDKYKEEEKKKSVTGENPLPKIVTAEYGKKYAYRPQVMYITPAAVRNNMKWRKLK